MTRSGLLVCATAAIALVGCLGRTGLSDGEFGASGAFDDGGGPGFDAGGPSADTSVPSDDGLPDGSIPPGDSGKPDARPPPPDSIDFFDIFPIPDGGPIGACASCVASHCAKQVNACLNDPTCRTGLLCTVTKCVGGGGGGPGGFDFACILGCFGGDFGKAAEAVAAFTCVISNCGSTCGGILGGGDGGLPGGGPGGGGGGGGSSDGGSGSGGGSGGSGGMSRIDGQAWTADDVQSIDPATRIGFSAESFDAWEDVRRARCELVAPR